MFPLGEWREVTGSGQVLVDSFTSALRWLSAYRFALEADLQPSNTGRRGTSYFDYVDFNQPFPPHLSGWPPETEIATDTLSETTESESDEDMAASEQGKIQQLNDQHPLLNNFTQMFASAVVAVLLLFTLYGEFQ